MVEVIGVVIVSIVIAGAFVARNVTEREQEKNL